MPPESFDLSDWKNTKIPKLAQLDALQRCLICKDFLKAPVITACNHTFCSQCIRQHLLNESRCPLCKSEQFESNLKRVVLLEEIVTCFQSLRQELIELATKHDGPDCGADAIHASPDASDASRSTHSVRSSPSPENEVIEILDEDLPLNDDSVKCPVCGDVMTADFLQRKHLDDCLNGKKRTPTPKRKRNEISLFFQRKRTKEVDHQQFYFSQAHKHHHDAKRLPKMDFASVSTPKLKEKMTALKLSVQGTRAQLELRYNHYYLLFNSNLDSNRPVSELEVRQKLNQWEKSHTAFKPVGANTIFGDSLAFKNIADKDFPVRAWAEKYREEYRELIHAARKSRRGKTSIEGNDTSKTTENSKKNTSNKSDEGETNQCEVNQNENQSGVNQNESGVNQNQSESNHSEHQSETNHGENQSGSKRETEVPKCDKTSSNVINRKDDTNLDIALHTHCNGVGAGLPAGSALDISTMSPHAENGSSSTVNTHASARPMTNDVLDFSSLTLFVP